MTYKVHGRFDAGFGWVAYPDEFMERSAAALAVDGRVWLIDPVRVPGIEKEFEALGTPAGIIMTIGWHDRDVDWYAALYGIPVFTAGHNRYVMVRSAVQRVAGQVPETPFQLLNTSMRGVMSFWTESALWWPEQHVLITGDCLGTGGYYLRPGERLAVHPFRRLQPLEQLRGLAPQRIYCGHGTSVQGDAAGALDHALTTAQPELWQAWRGAARSVWRRMR